MQEQEGLAGTPAVSTPTASSSKPALSLLQGLNLRSIRGRESMPAADTVAADSTTHICNHLLVLGISLAPCWWHVVQVAEPLLLLL